MNQTQKIIKYLAIAFATFLAVFIIFMIASGLSFVLRIFNIGGNIIGIVTDNDKEIIQEEGVAELFDDIKEIYISHGVGTIVMESDNVDKLSVYIEDNNESYKVSTRDDTLTIKHDRDFGNFFGFNWNKGLESKVVITLPLNYELDVVEIDGGAGDILLRDFNMDNLLIKAGAGLLTVNNVIAGAVDIDGGAGKLTFTDVEFNNSDISAGVGSLSITGKLLGRNSIEAGVGEINIKTKGKLEDYDITVEKGLGDVLINGSKYDNARLRQRDAKNSLDISGGVGRIILDFLD